MAAMGELEQTVMAVLWGHSAAMSVREVFDVITRDRDLAYTTVLTVLDRLAKKGLAKRRLDGRAWLYRPARSRVDEAVVEIRDLLAVLDPAERTQVLARITQPG